MPDKKGILMIAIGHPYYARLAYNLLVSIRYHDKLIPVTIVVAGNGFDLLDDGQKKLFNTVIRIPLESDIYRCKLFLDQYTGYDKTLYLDVDMIFTPNKTPQQLFDELDGKEFQCITRGRNGEKSEWLDMAEVKTEYGFDEIYDLSSEVIYFEGKPKIFEYARSVYDDHSLNIKPFGNGYPDEAFLAIAAEMYESDPSSKRKMDVPFEPSYWEPRYYPKQHSREIIQSHYLLSIGGAHINDRIKQIYESLNHMYSYHTGLDSSPFQLQSKSRIFNERRKI